MLAKYLQCDDFQRCQIFTNFHSANDDLLRAVALLVDQHLRANERDRSASAELDPVRSLFWLTKAKQLKTR